MAVTVAFRGTPPVIQPLTPFHHLLPARLVPAWAFEQPPAPSAADRAFHGRV
jgi:hypothetical protein